MGAGLDPPAGRRADVAAWLHPHRSGRCRLRAHRLPDDAHRRLGRRLPPSSFRTVRHLGVPWRLVAGPWSHADPSRFAAGSEHRCRRRDRRLLRRAPARRAGCRRRAGAGVRAPRRPPGAGPRRAPRGLARQAGTWPPPGWAQRVLTTDRDDVAELDVVGDVGTTAWISCAGALPWGQPTDQRIDDARSLTHDWPVAERLELAGNPSVRLRIRASAPVAHLTVKLCDVLPDGTSALISAWPAQPHPPGVLARRRGRHAPGAGQARSCPASGWTSPWAWRRRRGPSSPATPCASWSPAPTGRTPGRRRDRCASGSTGRRPS